LPGFPWDIVKREEARVRLGRREDWWSGRVGVGLAGEGLVGWDDFEIECVENDIGGGTIGPGLVA
jgi:hypothetical protein